MPILTVGPGQTYATLSDAIAASHDGDDIQVQAGTYTNDFAQINTKITIEGVGGMVNLVATVPPDNEKGILVTNTDVTLSNLEFSGAKVGDGNGAGIRYQGGNLTLNNCVFHDNQDGLLANLNLAGGITINNCVFMHNGSGDGFTHNLYVGEIGTLTVDHSRFTDAMVGHEIKSRAHNTIIENSVIADGPTASASYSIDLPNGGNSTVSNNFIEQGPNSENPAIIHFGGEGTAYVGSSLSISDNTIENDLTGGALAVLNQTTITVGFTDNRVFGLTDAQISNGPLAESGTTFLTAEPPIPCFATGTCIRTERGDIPVETVRVGDRVAVLFGGATQPVVWVGHRRVDCRRHPSRRNVWPVLIFAGAFGPGQPRRNLWLSPEHGVYLFDVLIPVRLLVNRRSIVQVPMSTVTYYHLELERHDVLLAEGMPVESYLDTGNRAAFGDGRGVVTLHPDFAIRQWEAAGCAPLVIAGPVLAAARHWVNGMADEAVCA